MRTRATRSEKEPLVELPPLPAKRDIERGANPPKISVDSFSFHVQVARCKSLPLKSSSVPSAF